jgi:ubiquinone/menaquinone biosynthesis C-methylase UbiE
MSADATRTAESESYLGGAHAHQQWHSDYLNPSLDRLYDRAFDRIVESLAPAPGATLLDAGCGYCFHAIRLARHGLKVTGVDFSESALREARQNVAEAGLGDSIHVERGNLLELAFPSASFDYVSCWGVLMHIPEIEAALGEFARVLKPNGKLVLMENDMRSLHVRFWEPTLRAFKRALRRRVPERRLTERGIEEWLPTNDGGLLVRKTDMDWLARHCATLGLRLVERFASQFTELYANLPVRALKRAVYRFNQTWFERVRSPRGAMGNILVFHKDG